MRRSLVRLVVLLVALLVLLSVDNAEAQEFCWIDAGCVGWCYEWGMFFDPQNIIAYRCCHLDGTCTIEVTIQGCCFW